MIELATRTCSVCRKQAAATSRFCPHCGAATARTGESYEILVPSASGNQIQLTQETLDLRALLTIVEASVAWWQKRLQRAGAVDRERAARAINELSRILDNLSAQVAQGNDTVRITTRFATTRLHRMTCPTCGHTNRNSARYCQRCGTALSETARLEASARERQEILRASAAFCSDTGKMRSRNEDTCYAGVIMGAGSTPLTLLLVADGMGGLASGDVASQIADKTARQFLSKRLTKQLPTQDADWQALLRDAVTAANQRVREQATIEGHQGMGTTLTLLLLVGPRAHIAHVGDSRAYLFHAEGITETGERLMRLTADHSLVARLVDVGQITPEQARTHPQRNIIYRALGAYPTVDVDTSSELVRTGDILLLCSDGLTIHLDDTALAKVLLQPHQPQSLCQQLIDQANAAGGQDNISVAVAHVAGTSYDTL